MKAHWITGNIRGWLWAIAGILALVTSCAVGPDYKRPLINTPPIFRGEAQLGTNSIAELAWWQIFQDPTLQGLIRTALTNNYDLRIAVSRVEQARALSQQNRALFYPQIAYDAGVSRGKNASPSGPLFSGGRTATVYDMAGNASWELDLWGRIRRLNEAAQAQFFASQEARRDVTVSLVAEVAQAYFQLLALDQQLAIAVGASNSFSGSLKIFSERLQGGVASNLETSRAEAALASAAATIPDLERQIVVQENLINVLVGRNPAPIPRPKTPLEHILFPDIPAGLPSALLERRPDIRQNEELLRAANAQVGVSVANFFPQISLTAVLGQISPQLSQLLSGGANSWSAGAGLAGPLFQGGRLTAQYRQARAAREEARLRYESSVITALQEVSNALVSRQKLAESRVQQARSVRAYQQAVNVSMQRYLVGNASYFEILESQQQLFPAQNTLVQTQLNQLLAFVQLYRALGGGWDIK